MAELRKPIVSHAATSPELSLNDYKYFLRTVPSDSEQVQAIMAVLNNQGWNYTQLVYADDAYGRAGKDELMMAMEKAGRCIVSSYAISPSSPTEDEIEDLVNDLVDNRKTRAVILLHTRTQPGKSLREWPSSKTDGVSSHGSEPRPGVTRVRWWRTLKNTQKVPSPSCPTLLPQG